MICRSIHVVLFLSLLACLANAQATSKPAGKEAPKGPRVVKLTFTPAPAPLPALKYQLLPSLADQEAGNAEPILYTASLLAEQVRLASPTDKLYESVIDWVDMPLDKLPREKVDKALDAAKVALRYARLASRREWCAWDVPYRSEGIDAQLPALVTQRMIARLLVVRARLAIADRRFNDALDDLQTVATVAHWLGEAPTLINNLVGMSNAMAATRGIESWINQPGSPNLYWALTDLPQPLVSTHKGALTERWFIPAIVPRLRELDSVVLSASEVRAIHDRLVRVLAVNSTDSTSATAPASDQEDRWVKAVIAHEQQARNQLLAAGYARQFVNAISSEQAVLLRLFDEYRELSDNFFKWFGCPYWQAEGPIAQMERQLDQDTRALRQEYGSGFFMELMPRLSRAAFLRSRTEQEIAILRCVEAIRLYAAGHAGQLPPALKDITEVPIPDDPVTGRPFVYECTGDQATLVGVVPDASSRDGIRYELSVKR